MYTKELESLTAKYGFNIHLYTDDTQICFAFDPKEDTSLSLEKLRKCFDDIKTWMAHNFLKMNAKKTDVMEIHPNKLSVPLIPIFDLDEDCVIDEPAKSAKNLGFWFDDSMDLDTQLDHVSNIAYNNLRNLGRIGSKLTHNLKIQLVHSLIHSILDYCNSTFGALTEIQIRKLQMIQNAGARFICN